MGLTKSSMVVAMMMVTLLANTAGAIADDDPPRKLVPFFLTSGETNPDSVTAFTQEMGRLGENTPGIQLLGAGEVRQQLRMAGVSGLAQAAVIRCGSDIACIADLGNKAGGSEVLLIRIVGVADEPEIVVQVLAIGTTKQEILRRTKLQIATPEMIRAALWENREALFGSAALEAVAVTDPEPAPADAKTQDSLAATTQPPSELVSQSWWRDRSLLRYVGVGVATVGGVLFVTGIGFGAHSSSVSNSIERDTSLPRAVELEGDANLAADRANGLFIGGTVLVLAGAGILAWELFGVDWFEQNSIGVAANETGATATVRMSW